MEEENNKPNGFQWFTLGFSICTLIFNTIILIAERKWKINGQVRQMLYISHYNVSKIKIKIKGV